jgi:hypothetical protein
VMSSGKPVNLLICDDPPLLGGWPRRLAGFSFSGGGGGGHRPEGREGGIKRTAKRDPQSSEKGEGSPSFKIANLPPSPRPVFP